MHTRSLAPHTTSTHVVSDVLVSVFLPIVEGGKPGHPFVRLGLVRPEHVDHVRASVRVVRIRRPQARAQAVHCRWRDECGKVRCLRHNNPEKHVRAQSSSENAHRGCVVAAVATMVKMVVVMVVVVMVVMVVMVMVVVVVNVRVCGGGGGGQTDWRTTQCKRTWYFSVFSRPFGPLEIASTC
jgi:hypothetical protein